MIIDFSNLGGGGSGSGYTLPVATSEVLGGIKVGQNLTIDSGGTLSADAQQVGIATTASTGVVKIGSGINVDSAGTISVSGSSYTLPTASSDTLGGVKIGSGVTIDSGGTISVGEPSSLPSIAIANLGNNKFGLVNSMKDTSIVTQTNTGLKINLNYIPYGVNMKVVSCQYSQHIFSVNTIDGGFNVTLVKTSDYSTVFNENITAYGTYAFGTSGTNEYVVVTYTQDNIADIDLEGRYLYNFQYDNYNMPVWKDNSGNTQVIIYRNPIATTGQTGLVQIGSGITVDENGVISASGGGGGIEVVTELPSSGTDGQMVLLVTVTTEKHIHITGMGTNSNPTQSVTAIGITEKTKLFDYNNYNLLCPVYVYPDGSYSIYDPSLDQENIYPVGETTAYSFTNGSNPSMNVTGVVTTTGCTFTVNPAGTWRQNAISDVDQEGYEKQTLYTWTDIPVLTTDIDYTKSGFTGDSNTWCVCFRYDEFPSDKYICNVWSNMLGSRYYDLYFYLENDSLIAYNNTEKSGNTITVTKNSFYKINGIGTIYGGCNVFWSDNIIILCGVPNGSNWPAVRFAINDDLKKGGWVKNTNHSISNTVSYYFNTYYDRNNEPIATYNSALNNVTHKINGTNYNIYSKDTTALKDVFAPETSGTTGYVCVAGSGNVAPTWAEPSTLTNGVKFWKGTQDQYDALSGTGYDNSTLYIIIPEE